MILKRIVNAIVTLPLLAALCMLLIHLIPVFAKHLNAFDRMSPSIWSGVGLLGAALLWIANIFGIILLVICALQCCCTGTGLLWRRVETGDVLQDELGDTVYIFHKDDLMWRWDPVFKLGKLPWEIPL